MTETVERRTLYTFKLNKAVTNAVKFWPIYMTLFFFNSGFFVPPVFDNTVLENYYRWTANAVGILSIASVWLWRYPALRKIGASIAFGRFISAIVPSMFPPLQMHTSCNRVLNNGITALVLTIALLKPHTYSMVRVSIVGLILVDTYQQDLA